MIQPKTFKELYYVGNKLCIKEYQIFEDKKWLPLDEVKKAFLQCRAKKNMFGSTTRQDTYEEALLDLEKELGLR